MFYIQTIECLKNKQEPQYFVGFWRVVGICVYLKDVLCYLN